MTYKVKKNNKQYDLTKGDIVGIKEEDAKQLVENGTLEKLTTAEETVEFNKLKGENNGII